MQTENRSMERWAWLAAARRSLILDTPPLECPMERTDAKRDAAKHLQQAALLAVRAGRPEVATQLLATWEQLEAGK